MKFQMNALSVIALSAMFGVLAACQPQEGPAERAGKSVDNAASKVGEKIEKAGDNIQDAAKGDK